MQIILNRSQTITLDIICLSNIYMAAYHNIMVLLKLLTKLTKLSYC